MTTAVDRAFRVSRNWANTSSMKCSEVLEETVDQRLTPRGKACKEAQSTIQVLAVYLHAPPDAHRSIDM